VSERTTGKASVHARGRGAGAPVPFAATPRGRSAARVGEDDRKKARAVENAAVRNMKEKRIPVRI
jgi:hypothetical protein